MLNLDQLHGLSESHLVVSERFECKLHPDAERGLCRLADEAALAGIEIRVASGFRSFERQLAIWQAKAAGELRLMDHAGECELEAKSLAPAECIRAILRWSALPGASRHHWGTDVDIFDGAAIDNDYRLQLTPWEYSEEGPFSSLSRWLAAYVDSPQADFYLPYAQDLGGVGPEPWHVSYRPLAQQCEQQLGCRELAQMLAGKDFHHKSDLMAHLPEVYDQFIASSYS